MVSDAMVEAAWKSLWARKTDWGLGAVRAALEAAEAVREREVMTKLKKKAAEIVPIVRIGDEDSIYLTDYQKGRRDGLLEAAARVSSGEPR